MRFRAELWRWESPAASWQFLTVPEDVSAEIADLPRPPRGFGSVKVGVAIGATNWQTSVFPDSKSGFYLLPVKKAVRAKEGIDVGDSVNVQLTLVDDPR